MLPLALAWQCSSHSSKEEPNGESHSRRDILGGTHVQQLTALIPELCGFCVPMAELYGFCVPAFSQPSLNFRMY